MATMITDSPRIGSDGLFQIVGSKRCLEQRQTNVCANDKRPSFPNGWKVLAITATDIRHDGASW